MSGKMFAGTVGVDDEAVPSIGGDFLEEFCEESNCGLSWFGGDFLQFLDPGVNGCLGGIMALSFWNNP